MPLILKIFFRDFKPQKQGRPFHSKDDAGCYIEKLGGTIFMHTFVRSGGRLYRFQTTFFHNPFSGVCVAIVL